jgi:hypothetical protein
MMLAALGFGCLSSVERAPSHGKLVPCRKRSLDISRINGAYIELITIGGLPRCQHASPSPTIRSLRSTKEDLKTVLRGSDHGFATADCAASPPIGGCSPF